MDGLGCVISKNGLHYRVEALSFCLTSVCLSRTSGLTGKRVLGSLALCGLRGCKNGPAPFRGRMSYKATKPGLVCVLYLSMFFIVLVFIRAPFYVLLVFIVCFLSFGCSS